MNLRPHGKHRKGQPPRYVIRDGIVIVNGTLTSDEAKRIKERFTGR